MNGIMFSHTFATREKYELLIRFHIFEGFFLARVRNTFMLSSS